MTRPRGQDDLQLEPPTVKSAETVPAVEDRSYLGYIGGALVMALAGGFLLAVLLPLAITGVLPWEERTPQLTQAHGWAQLQGFAGLFVAGMAMRLIPRFAGRQPIRRTVTLPVLVLLLAGVVLRTVAQPAITGRPGEVLLVVAGLLSGAGSLAVAAVLAVTLAKGRRKREPWRYFAFAGAAWWAAWAVLTVVAGFRAADNARYTPATFDEPLTWIVTFGAVANFVWGVQSRSVPVFFGRKTPSVRAALAPGLLLNGGTLLILVSLLDLPDVAAQRLQGAGLLAAGVASCWLAPVAGSVWGTAHRLRPRARQASHYVLAANVVTVVAGVLVAYAGARTLGTGEFEAFGARDAARHAFGLGMITMLIIGMARLVAPVFALERAEPGSTRLFERAPLWLLVAAVVLRVGAGLAFDHMDTDGRMHLAAAAGVLAWLALAVFAASVVRAIRAEPRMKALLGFK
ncbi:MAG: NnrS family protein [Dehalococcoidia bacterium]|nr:NnrS family protein [Dehalococcoidia bacterium]